MFILAINPGSTSTKVAIYEDEKELYNEKLKHTREELDQFETIADQLDFRHDLVMKFMNEIGFAPNKLDCVVSRGGMPPNARSGATEINETLVTVLRERPLEPHPACVGPVIAYRIAQDYSIPSYIVDPVTADELNPYAKVFGVKGIEYDSMCHVLNTRAMGISVAKEMGRPFNEMTIIVAHIGGGLSVGCWHKGLLHDTVPQASFSAERCGSFMRVDRIFDLVEKHGKKTYLSWLHGKGGMVSVLGTNDLLVVEHMVDDGHEEATFYMKAMAYQLARSITSMLAPVNGEVDAFVLTGGGARWPKFIEEVKSRISFLNKPIFLRPGEDEMKALAEGAYRVMTGEETAHIYSEV